MKPSGSEPSSSWSSVPSAWSAANSRPSESMQESSAATQITPGAIERSSSGSAPMPSGNRLVTITKNSSAVATSLRRRHATRRSRTTMQRAASSIQVDNLRGAHAGVLMRREHHGPAACHVAVDQLLDQATRRCVERGIRLVEQPKGKRIADDQPRQHRSPPLTLRQSLHREIGQFERIEGLLYLPRRDAKPGEGAGDAQILRGGEVVLHRGCVADVDQLLRVLIAQAPDFRSLPAHRAGGRRQQSAENTQEARLAAAVGPGDAQKLAAAQRDRQVAEQCATAALATQMRCLEVQFKSSA